MTYATINPASGEQLVTFETTSDIELEAALEVAHRTYSEDWRRRSIADRAAVLRSAAAEFRAGADRYAKLLTLEMGKPIGQAQFEVELSASILDYYADRAEELLAPSELEDSPGASVISEPIGVILAIEPWNFPYYQAVRVAAPQLVAGNVVVLKHAENVPQAALAIARIFEKAGAPAGVYTNIFATHDQVVTLIADARIAGVTLTGSERAGAVVAAEAGRNLKKVVLELGGNDPLIILGDAALDHALEMAVFSRVANNGQACVNAKRIIVVGKERGEEALRSIVDQMAAIQLGDPADPAVLLGPVSSQRALDSLIDQLEVATGAGAAVACGGKRVDRPGFYLEPTVLTDITPENPAYSTEFFGPVLSFFTVDTEDEAIRLANDSPYGLSCSVFTGDPDRGRLVASRIDAGMVFVNQATWTAPELPFGGIKRSGFGRELSALGIGEFVNRKLVNIAVPGAALMGPAPV